MAVIERRKGPLTHIRQVIRVINRLVDDINTCFDEVDGSVSEDYTSDIAMLARKVVYIKSDGKIDYADKDASIDFKDIIGVTANAGNPGDPITVVLSGIVDSASIASVSSSFFLGNSGDMVTTAPTSGTLVHIATQTATDEITVKIEPPLRRA